MMILLMPDALHPLVEDVKLDSVSTGVAKVMGNKGGVGVSFFYAGISLLFVCCHLAAHQENVEERNNDFKRITSSLFGACLLHFPITPWKVGGTPLDWGMAYFGTAKEGGRAGKRSAKVSPASVDRDASEEHHATIWLGDLNYRVEGSRDAINRVLEQEMLEVLHENDQLRKEVKRGNAFPGFREVTPSFLPTYKVMPRTGEYDMSGKRRIPSWTDRILFKAEPMNGEGKVDVGGLHYDSIPSLLFSDHVPVTAVVEMRLSAGWRSPTVASPSNSNRSGKSWCSIQ